MPATVNVAINIRVPKLLMQHLLPWDKVDEPIRGLQIRFASEVLWGTAYYSFLLMLILCVAAARIAFFPNGPIRGRIGQFTTLSFLVVVMNIAISFPGCLLVGKV